MTYTPYIAVAHDLDSDDAEWSIFTGANAKESARHAARRWAAKPGRWVARTYPLASEHGAVIMPGPMNR